MSQESLVTGIAHLGIRVHDMNRAARFYALLGFELVAGPIGPEPVAVLKHPDGIEINLILNAAEATDSNILMDIPKKHAGYTHAAFSVRDVDAATAMFAEHNIPLSGGPVTYPNGGRSIFVRDPDRNTVELLQPPPAAS